MFLPDKTEQNSIKIQLDVTVDETRAKRLANCLRRTNPSDAIEDAQIPYTYAACWFSLEEVQTALQKLAGREVNDGEYALLHLEQSIECLAPQVIGETYQLELICMEPNSKGMFDVIAEVKNSDGYLSVRSRGKFLLHKLKQLKAIDHA